MLCYLVVTSGTIIKPRPSNSINLVEEDEARFLGPGETVKSNPRKKKMFSDLAISKSSRTILAPSPTYFCTNSDPITLQDGRMPIYSFKKRGSNHLMKQASVLLATALAHRVLPVPGGPYNKTPFGGSIPRFTKRSGWRRGVSTTLNGIDISLPLFSFLN